jgi:NADPH:quinone reductase-like Zn-dependent oxidoreductase
MKAVQIKSYGDPHEVLEVVDVPEPKAPGVNEALIGIELAALTKYDLLSISKALGGGPALPTIVGTEGFGRVLAVATSRMSRLAIACLHHRFPKPGVRK